MTRRGGAAAIHRLPPRAVKEREFQKWVTDTAELYGWRWWHCPTPMQPIGRGRFVPDKRGAGVADLILMHPDPARLIFAEVKVTEPVSAAQKEFLRMGRAVAEATSRLGLEKRTVGCYVWRFPEHVELIEATLAA